MPRWHRRRWWPAPPGIWRDVAIALALGAGPDRRAADAAVQSVIEQHGAFAAYQIAGVYALRGDADRSFEWLDRALANRDPGITFLLYDPLLRPYRNDPRFIAFARKIGLPMPAPGPSAGAVEVELDSSTPSTASARPARSQQVRPVAGDRSRGFRRCLPRRTLGGSFAIRIDIA